MKKNKRNKKIIWCSLLWMFLLNIFWSWSAYAWWITETIKNNIFFKKQLQTVQNKINTINSLSNYLSNFKIYNNQVKEYSKEWKKICYDFFMNNKKEIWLLYQIDRSELQKYLDKCNYNINIPFNKDKIKIAFDKYKSWITVKKYNVESETISEKINWYLNTINWINKWLENQEWYSKFLKEIKYLVSVRKKVKWFGGWMFWLISNRYTTI